MADILIRGIVDIPVGQEFVIVENIDFERYLYNRETGAAFHLISLPEGHGDLIDRDNVLLDIDCTGTNKFGMLDEDIRAFLRRYKPIVPAEGVIADGN